MSQIGGFTLYIVTGLVAGILFNQEAKAATQSARSKMSQNETLRKESPFSGSITGSHSQKLIDRKDGSQYSSADLFFSLGYKLSSSWSFRGKIGYTQDLKDSENTDNDFSDLSLTAKYNSLPDFKYLSQGLTLSNTIPVSRESREIDQLKTTLGIRYSLSSLKKWLIPGFSYFVSVGASKNFHEFETTTTGSVLNSHRLSQTAGVGYKYKKWSFEADISHSQRFNYENRVSQGISHSQTIDYEAVAGLWSIGIGHSNEGPWFKENGEDLNLDAVSDENSVFYIQTSLSF